MINRADIVKVESPTVGISEPSRFTMRGNHRWGLFNRALGGGVHSKLG